jgi:aldehyde dehydrogenase (NAD+)
LNNGKPFAVAKAADLNLTHKCYRYYAGWVDKIRGSIIPINAPFLSYTTK